MSGLSVLPGLILIISMVADASYESDNDLASLLNDHIVLVDNDLNELNNSSVALRSDGKNEEVQFHLYTKKRPNVAEKFVLRRRRNLYSSFNPRLPTKIVIHGWQGSADQHYSALMKDAFVPKFDMNVILVDWSHHGSKKYNYISASREVVRVAELVAKFIDDLNRLYGVHPSRLHILGHSLGAHVAGVAARKITSGKVNRITGFDPAGVLYKEKTEDRLRSDSAEFVDVIHTSTNILGHSMPMGHIDIYPNGGKAPQPGCGWDVTGACSHQRAHLYYIESLNRMTGFPAAHCGSWDRFKQKECDFTKVAFLSENINKRLRGLFYLETNDKPPYSRGLSWV